MRPKARGLAKHGGPPGWLHESDKAGVILYAIDGLYRLSFPYHYQLRLTEAAQLRADEISSCCFIINVHITQPSVMSYITQVDPCLLSRIDHGFSSAHIPFFFS